MQELYWKNRRKNRISELVWDLNVTFKSHLSGGKGCFTKWYPFFPQHRQIPSPPPTLGSAHLMLRVLGLADAGRSGVAVQPRRSQGAATAEPRRSRPPAGPHTGTGSGTRENRARLGCPHGCLRSPPVRHGVACGRRRRSGGGCGGGCGGRAT